VTDPIDLDWQFTQTFPGDPAANGVVAPVGAHVFCQRPSDRRAMCGIVDDNRCGLFITRCTGHRSVLTAANWDVHITVGADTCTTA
jgi:hypothetical protein